MDKKEIYKITKRKLPDFYWDKAGKYTNKKINKLKKRILGCKHEYFLLEKTKDKYILGCKRCADLKTIWKDKL